MYMVWFVLDQPELLDNIQKAWEEVGINGATIIESSGFFRRKKGKKFVATRYILPNLSESVQKGNYSIFSLVETEQQVQLALEATEKVTGDLSLQNTGVFAAWPLMVVKGYQKAQKDQDEGEA
jgi:nitrogen regulatory protein PII